VGRLIDAGYLKAKLETQKVFKRTTLTEYECGYNRGLNMAAFCLENTETAKAIPVDWIKRYMKEVGLTDVKYMLETWEKEQIYGKDD
jgi:hypothetical protein